MATVTYQRTRHVAAPKWPTLALGFYASLAAVSLLQGVVDLVVPALQGDAPFGFLYAGTETFGPAFLGAYVFVHNLGLASLVPGFGFVALWFEKHPPNRRVIAMLLVGAVVATLLVSVQYIIQSGRFDLVRTLPLFAAEAVGVLVLAIPAARQMRGFVPTPAYGWSLVTPLRSLRAPLLASVLILGACSLVEVWMIMGA